MKAGIQTFLSEAGDAACYALDIVQIASRHIGRDIDPIYALDRGIAARMIHYSWANPDDNDNFFVTDPAGLLTLLTGDVWTVEKVGPDYVASVGEHVVERWERQVTGSTIGHFRLPDWDSLVDSKTVRFGAIVSKRVFRRKR